MNLSVKIFDFVQLVEVSSPNLEALPTTSDARLDPHGDTINAREV